MLTYETLKQDKSIRSYIAAADASLAALGYTEHSFPHVTRVAQVAAGLLTTLGYSPREVELAKIAGYMHDIGNLVNRVDHSQSGALIAFRLLEHLGMPADEVAAIVTAIGNHDEGTGVPVSPMAAALILADKSDVRRTRVRNTDPTTFDIHDRVNYSVTEAILALNETRDSVTLSLQIDTAISPVMEYFEIFLGRMVMCRRAAAALGVGFCLSVNGQPLS